MEYGCLIIGDEKLLADSTAEYFNLFGDFRRNRIPLEKTGAPLTLALKTTLSGIKQNVTVCVTMLVLSLVAVFSGLMERNVVADGTDIDALNLEIKERLGSEVNAVINTLLRWRESGWCCSPFSPPACCP